MKKILLTLLFLFAAFYGVNYMFKRNDPAKGESRLIEIATEMTVKQFIEQNHLEMGPREPQGYVIPVDKITDTMPIQFVDNWIRLRVEDGAQSFELPPGRTLHVDQKAGRIHGLAFRPFAQPRPLPEMHDYIVSLLAMLEQKGWRPTSPTKVPSKPEDFDFNGKSLFAELVSPSGNVLQMNLRDYGMAPKQESFILNVNPAHTPAAESRTYLLQVTMDNDNGDISYSDMLYPRRIFVHGSEKKDISLRLWIDDPDWTPQKAGMVPTTPEERPHSYSSKWKMPEK